MVYVALEGLSRGYIGPLGGGFFGEKLLPFRLYKGLGLGFRV